MLYHVKWKKYAPIKHTITTYVHGTPCLMAVFWGGKMTTADNDWNQRYTACVYNVYIYIYSPSALSVSIFFFVSEKSVIIMSITMLSSRAQQTQRLPPRRGVIKKMIFFELCRLLSRTSCFGREEERVMRMNICGHPIRPVEPVPTPRVDQVKSWTKYRDSMSVGIYVSSSLLNHVAYT